VHTIPIFVQLSRQQYAPLGRATQQATVAIASKYRQTEGDSHDSDRVDRIRAAAATTAAELTAVPPL